MEKHDSSKEEHQQISKLPSRPQRSKNIHNLQTVELVTNMFKIQPHIKFISCYSIEISPEIEKNARQFLGTIIHKSTSEIQKKLIEFVHSGWNIFAPGHCKHTDILFKLDHKNKEYEIYLKFTHEINLEQNGEDKQSLMVYNNIHKKMLASMGLTAIGQNAKYYKKEDVNKNIVPNSGINVWQGFKSSIDFCKDSLYLQIDFNSRILRKETALDIMYQTTKKADVKENLIGKSVITSYSQRIYRIYDIEFNLRITDKMKEKEGMTYLQYYKEKYDIDLKDKDQPLIVHKDKRNFGRKIYLIPELMKMTGLTDRQKGDFKLMQSVAQFTKLDPADRMKKIEDHATAVSKFSGDMKVQILPQSTKVKGFKLPAPKIITKNNTINVNDGTFQLKGKLENPAYFKHWILVYFNEEYGLAKSAQESFKEAGKAFGIYFEDAQMIEINSKTAKGWIEGITKYTKNYKQKPQIAVTIVPTFLKKYNLYQNLKAYFFGDLGIPHQNIISKTLEKKNSFSIFQKIVLQMNCKVGKPLWTLEKLEFMDKHTMYVGIDVYHKTSMNKKSCAAFNASLSSDSCETFSRIIMQDSGQEVILNSSLLMSEALEAYKKKNKRYPTQIIVFRDGVGEGQFNIIKQQELQSMMESLAEKNIEKTKLAFILINKRINNRFFRTGGHKLSNPEAGTVIADEVTSNNYDFFLTAQKVNQGTCTPTHFHVVYDTTGLKEDEFWKMCNFQCYTYFNWFGAVRCPGPAQNAHKLAYLFGENLDCKIHQDLEYLQYYY